MTMLCSPYLLQGGQEWVLCSSCCCRLLLVQPCTQLADKVRMVWVQQVPIHPRDIYACWYRLMALQTLPQERRSCHLQLPEEDGCVGAQPGAWNPRL
jgi:hypothetical protein